MIGAIRAVCFALATTTPGELFDALPLLLKQFLGPLGFKRTFLLRPRSRSSNRRDTPIIVSWARSCPVKPRRAWSDEARASSWTVG